MPVKKSKQDGFTLIELMIATTIFTFIMLIATTGIIRIGQLYYKSVTQAKTQDAARSISDELSRSVQFANGVKQEITSFETDFPQEKFCLGDTMYTAYLDVPYKPTADDTPTGNPSGLWAEKLSSGTSCDCTVSGGCSFDETKQLLGNNMRLLKLDLSILGEGIDKAWNVNLRVGYGDNDLLTHYDGGGVLLPSGGPEEKIELINGANCKTGISGGSFCAISQLDTVVKKRLN